MGGMRRRCPAGCAGLRAAVLMAGLQWCGARGETEVHPAPETRGSVDGSCWGNWLLVPLQDPPAEKIYCYFWSSEAGGVSGCHELDLQHIHIKYTIQLGNPLK